MAKSKINKPSTDKEKQTKLSDTLERLSKVDPNCEYSFSNRSLSAAYLEKVADQLITWVMDEENNLRPYSLKNFCRYLSRLEKRQISRDSLDYWAAQNKVFGAALKYAKEVIGSRRYDLRVEHRFDEKAFYLNQRHYDDEFEEDFKKYNEAVKASLPNGGTQGPTVINISSKAAEQVGLEVHED